MPDKSGDQWLSQEIDPSTRDSVHIFTKWVPVDSTLTTPGTAQNLFSISTERPTVNLATNPSFETGAPPTGYTATGAVITQSAVVARTGANSLSIDPANAVVGEGAFYTTESLGSGRDPNLVNWLVASAFFQDNANLSNTVRIEIRNAAGTTTLATGNQITLTSAWQRSTAAFQLTPVGSIYRVYFVTSGVASDPVFFVDSFQAEIGINSTASTYCDGAQGLNYEWDSTAHASTSRRRMGLVAIRGYNLYTTRNCYIAFDHTSSSTLGRRVLAGTDFWSDFPIHVRSNISFINELVGEAPRVFGEILGVHKT